VLGEKRKSPRMVFEHPGEATIPTSMFVCDTGGMVVICAGTTGYNATVDLRYLWMRQKRVQGSHFANDDQAYIGLNNMVLDGKVDPCLSRTFTYDELPHVHQLMHDNKHPHGNMAVLIGADPAVLDPAVLDRLGQSGTGRRPGLRDGRDLRRAAPARGHGRDGRPRHRRALAPWYRSGMCPLPLGARISGGQRPR
jgi:hypothetical protein